MALFVLVHGVFDGGWVWDAVRQSLREAGHTVIAPTLTGYGERSHLAGPKIDLETHIRDISNVLDYRDLRDAVLVGHSYGGMIITGAGDRTPERVRHLVYLDAFVPQDGEPALDLAAPDSLPADPPTLGQRLRRAASQGLWQLAPPEGDRRRSPVLVNPLTHPIRLTGAGAALPCTFIRCTGGARGASPDFTLSEHRARSRPGRAYYELAAGHAAVWQDPPAVSALLLQLLASEGAADRDHPIDRRL